MLSSQDMLKIPKVNRGGDVYDLVLYNMNIVFCFHTKSCVVQECYILAVSIVEVLSVWLNDRNIGVWC